MKQEKSIYRLFTTIMVVLFSLTSWADGDNYTLTINASPSIGGTFNVSSATLNAGESIQLIAYASGNFSFVEWTDTNGESISKEQDFTYTMPNRDMVLTAKFRYNPANPSNPASNHWDLGTGEVIVDDFTTGFLADAISSITYGSEKSDIKSIIISGIMDANDYGVVNTYTDCIIIDLSRVTGINNVPSYAFDNTNLEYIFLPNTIESIGDAAFSGCSQLSVLTVYSKTPPILGNNVFSGVSSELIVYVPSASVNQYKDTNGWGSFAILPIQEDIRKITVSLPNGTNVADYAKMWLELTNTKSGQRMHYVLTDRTQYTFSNIIRNTEWNVVLRNERGDVFGQIDNVEVEDVDVNVTFSSLSKPQTVKLSVLSPNEQDVTAQTQITWMDSQGNYISQGTSLSGLPVGYQLGYRVVLSQELAMLYNTPALTEYILNNGNNNIVCQLESINQVQLTGKVKDKTTGLPLSGAVISASQTFGGKYSKTLTAKTDANGAYALTVASVPTSIAYAATNYISQIKVLADSELNPSLELEGVLLQSITGATITLGFSYTSCDGETQNWYSDYQNVSYELFNVTKNQSVSQYNVQYPQIVLLEEVADGDVLRLTATSRTNAFMPVTATATIAEQKAEATFAVVELGKIKSSFTSTGNAAVVGSLYDSTGKLIKTYTYSNASLTINNLTDGQYSLITMGDSRLFNTIYDLSQLPQTGLIEGTDYVQNSVEVKSGQISAISISEVPTLDESKLYYTGDNTSFTVNKPSIVAGNYLTLTGRIDFKSAYATSVSNVKMIVDLPKSCEFVENSVMVGNNTSSYTINGHQITIPIARYTDRVRFCIIPTLGGEYSPSAFAQFDLNGETVTQPIGSANYTAKGLSISVPSSVAKSSIPVSGTAIGKSDIEIYDNDVLIGRTTSLANGTWATTCELNKAYNLSKHRIYAKATTKKGIELITETKICVCDLNAIQVSNVKMYHYNPEMRKTYEVIFDFLNPSAKAPKYTYYIYNREFSFTIDFTINDPTKVSNVVLNIKTGSGKWTKLPATFDMHKNCWIAKGLFGNMYDGDVPKNVAVSYDIDTENIYDVLRAEDLQTEILEIATDDSSDDEELEDLEEQLNEELEKEDVDMDKVMVIVTKINIHRPTVSRTDPTDANILYKNISESKADDVGKIIDQHIDNLHKEIKQKTGADLSNIKDLNGEIPAGTQTYKDDNTGKSVTFTYEPGSSSDFMQTMSKYRLDEQASQAGKIVLTNEETGGRISLDATTSVQIPQEYNTKEDYMRAVDKIMDFVGYNNELNSLSTVGSLGFSYWDKGLDDAIEATRDAYIESLKKLENCAPEEFAENLAKSRALGRKVKEAKSNARVAKNAGRIFGGIFTAMNTYNDINQYYSDENRWEDMIGDLYTLCDHETAVELEEQARQYQKEIRRKNLRKGAGEAAIAIAGAVGAGFSGLTFGASLTLVGGSCLGGWGMQHYADCIEKDNRRNLAAFKKAVKSKATCKPFPDDGDNWEEYSGAETNVSIDPSGYVYEGVMTNRVEGVTATIYYKETVEDMYGDLHENIVRWDAEEYAQENPLFTDENGFYRWDVPQGLWQVKFEKEGYETTYSEWLPVPPPQLDVNISMKQNVQPNVKLARAYEDAVEVEFDKYMMPELLTAENIMVMQNETIVEGAIELLNEQAAYEGATETYASKVRFNATVPFTASEVTLMVSNRVKSYAGIRMQDDFSQTFTIEPEIRNIVCAEEQSVFYGETSTLTISVEPANASAGKTLLVKSSSPMILSTSAESVVIDNEGKATFEISGELPGAAAIMYSVEGYDLQAMTSFSVKQKEVVAVPMVDLASGTTVEEGTEVHLTCSTPGATIYYTLDSSCPCEEATRLTYTGSPIIINSNTTIKAMAVAVDMDDSDVQTFNYNVLKTLDENATSVPLASTKVNVKVERTINADEWSTICLPFSMIETQVKSAFGNDVELGDFIGYNVADDGNSINVLFNEATAIEANHPYIIKVGKAVTEFTVDNVDIAPDENPIINKGTNTEPQSFIGNYLAGTAIEKGGLFLNDNKFWYSIGATRIKAFRAYFKFFDLLPDFVNNYAEAPVFILFDSQATNIRKKVLISDEGSAIPPLYNLNGQRVVTPKNGVYIKNNKKIVVR